MKLRHVLYSVCVIALAQPMVANAEIYKWKDSNGVTRYSDTPPKAGVNVDTMGKTGKDKAARPVAPEGSSPVRETGAAKPKRFKEPEFEKKTDASEKAASIKAKNEEIEKKNKLAEAERAELNVRNCKAAKANYQSFAQGGRIYKMNENGERVYMDDAGLESGKAQAQSEIDKYCK